MKRITIKREESLLSPAISVISDSIPAGRSVKVLAVCILTLLLLPEPSLLMAGDRSVWQQGRQVSGVVVNEQGNPFPWVTVFVKGITTIGTLTDGDGRYSLNVPDRAILGFIFVGYKELQIPVGNRDTINVKMEIDKRALDEVLVIGFSEGSRRDHISSPAAAHYLYHQGYHHHYIPDYKYRHPYAGEEYGVINESGFRSVRGNPLSTFSIDVDGGAWSNIRRFINDGTLPPPDAVRIEEMLNYFRYDYPEPADEHPFAVSSELTAAPWNNSNYLLKIGIKAVDIDKSDLPPSNLVFLIDVSGSMFPQNRLPLLKSAFRMLVGELRPVDNVSIVVYASSTRVLLESARGDEKERIIAAIESLGASGSTAGGSGLQLAYRVAEANFIEGGNNRIILATDGDFNVGISSVDEMMKLIESKRKKGISMTALGVGMGNYRDHMLESIARTGDGNYAYLDNLQEAHRVLVTEFGGTLFTVAKDVKLQVEFNPEHISSYRLIGYENRLLESEDFNDDSKDAGDMGSGHTVTALYELVPVGAATGERPLVDPLRYRESPQRGGDISGELLNIKVRYKQPDSDRSLLLDHQVLSSQKRRIELTSDDFRFAAAVAGFGMLLRSSEHGRSITHDQIVDLASGARGGDDQGYRAEFIRLVETSRTMGNIPGGRGRW